MEKGQNTPITDIIQLDASIPVKMAKQTTYNIDGRNFIVTLFSIDEGLALPPHKELNIALLSSL